MLLRGSTASLPCYERLYALSNIVMLSAFLPLGHELSPAISKVMKHRRLNLGEIYTYRVRCKFHSILPIYAQESGPSSDSDNSTGCMRLFGFAQQRRLQSRNCTISSIHRSSKQLTSHLSACRTDRAHTRTLSRSCWNVTHFRRALGQKSAVRFAIEIPPCSH